MTAFQLAYRKHHSTESALLNIHNDILLNMVKRSVTAPTLLDLSTAFDTIDHTPFSWTVSVGVFHNHNPSNLDSSDQQIRLCCDLNLNLDYESVDLPLEVDQPIQIA